MQARSVCPTQLSRASVGMGVVRRRVQGDWGVAAAAVRAGSAQDERGDGYDTARHGPD